MSLASKPIVSQPPRRAPNVRAVVFTEDAKSSKTFLKACLEQTDGSVWLRVVGAGKHTLELVKEAESQLPGLEKELAKKLARVEKFSKCKKDKLKNKGKKRVPFDQVWIVFDRDDHPDFDKAVKEVKRLGFKEGWSNECFELWYYLYSKQLDSAELKNGVGRKVMFSYLTNKYSLEERFEKKYEKLKGDAGAGFHNEMAHDMKAMQNAYRQACALEKCPRLVSKTPSQRNPYTLVHNLIVQLLPEIALAKTRQ